MKILYIANTGTIHTKRWVDFFRSKGHEMYVLSANKKEIPGVKVIVTPAKDSRGHFKRMIRSVRYLMFVRSQIRRIKPDIVHIHYLPEDKMVFAYLGIKNLVVSVYGSDIIDYDFAPRPRRTAYYRKFIFRQASVLTATSNFLADSARPYTDKAIHVIPFGIEPDKFRPRSPGQGKRSGAGITLGFIKHLNIKYGPEYLVRAMAYVAEKYPGTRLIMAGGGDLREKIEGMIRELRLEKNISLVGVIPHDEVASTLDQVDVFVMPSLSEGFGVAALEAMAREIPIIASNSGAIPEIVVDGITGILVEPRNVLDLSRAITDMIENPGMRTSMGKAGREYALKRYQWQENAALMESVYEKFRKN